MRLIILGPPGSGKGTQSKLLSTKYGVPAISVGALLREEVRMKTSIGLKSKEYMVRGDWVPHELTFSVLKNRLQKKDVSEGFVLDAFPRLSAEYHQLGSFLIEQRWNLDAVINLKVSDYECMRRILVRAEIQSSKGVFRPDNDESTVLNRIKVHHASSQNILEYYKESGLLREIDGSEPIGIVHRKILNVLQE